jgi:hypothetical protein
MGKLSTGKRVDMQKWLIDFVSLNSLILPVRVYRIEVNEMEDRRPAADVWIPRSYSVVSNRLTDVFFHKFSI